MKKTRKRTIAVKVHRTTNSECSVELGENDVLSLLGRVIPKGAKNVEAWIRVPGGADWSNCKLVIGEDVPLMVSWETSCQEDLEADFDK